MGENINMKATPSVLMIIFLLSFIAFSNIENKKEEPNIMYDLPGWYDSTIQYPGAGYNYEVSWSEEMETGIVNCDDSSTEI